MAIARPCEQALVVCHWFFSECLDSCSFATQAVYPLIALACIEMLYVTMQKAVAIN